MEEDFNGNEEEEEEDNNNIDSIKEIRKQLEARIATQKLTQQQRIDSLQTLVPDLVSSLHLSLKVVSAFNNTHYPPPTPTPNPPSPQNPNPPEIPENPLSKKRLLEPQTTTNSNSSYKKINTSPKQQYPSSELTQESPESSSCIGDDEIQPRSIPNGNVALKGATLTTLRPMPPMFPTIGSPMFSQFPPFRPPMRRNSTMGSFDFTSQKPASEEDDMRDLEELLNKKSFRERQNSDSVEQLLDLINRPTAMETAKAAKFKSKGGSQVKEYCSALTKEDCRRQSRSYVACDKVHFRRIIAQHTDITLGNCGFLDGCHHMKTCRKVHYELDNTPDVPMMMGAETRAPPKPIKQSPEYCSEIELGEPQWINCDIRTFRMDILGQFGVIMADPPWDIHMKLPYGTMADDEMKELNVPTLQTDGLIFLWVTGRAIELGRDCLELWGYKCVEELIWVKTDQLQQIIRTGRTGHWLNHSKEHCLVGIKGNPEVNRNIDTNVIVAAVRETSRKPDEMYSLLERLSPRTRKLELFARVHNTHAGWISLGNQLEGVRLVDEGLRARFKAAYPDVEVDPPSPRRTAIDIDSSTAQTRSPFMDIGSKATPVQFTEPVASVSYASGEKTNGCQDVSVV